MRFYALFIPFCLLTSLAWSQYLVKGRVLEEKTNKPIPGAAVFINNTEIGTLSDKYGYFALSIPTNIHPLLVIKCLGYQTNTIEVDNTNSGSLLTIPLEIIYEKLKSITVFPDLKDGWEKYGALFRKLLLGRTYYADRCRIKNEDQVHFRLDKNNNVLYAYSDQDLIILNNVLGYEIKYDLENFSYNLENHLVVFGGYSRFNDLSKSNPQKRENWLQNRKMIYCGSEMHFFRALYSNSLDNEDFEVRRLVRSVNIMKQRALAYFKSGQDSKYLALASEHPKGLDSIQYFKPFLKEPDTIILKIKTSPDNLLERAENNQVYFSSPDTLQIYYTYKGEIPNVFRDYLFKFNQTHISATNFLFIHKRTIEIFENGAFDSIYDLQIQGFWSISGSFATLLPFDYTLN